jgi:hypothetical protein
MTLIISYPDNFNNERKWILSSLFSRIAADFTLIECQCDDWKITVSGSGRSIVISDILIPLLYKDKAMKMQQPQIWDAGMSLPILHSVQSDKIVYSDNDTITCFADIFGMAFWMMSRWEEVYSNFEKDKHGRFNSCSSYLKKYNLISRPWVDEWVLWLKNIINDTFPSLVLIKWEPKTIITHDVDIPFIYAFSPPSMLIRRIAGDLIKRKSLSLAFKTPVNWFRTRRGRLESDPAYNFDWIMDQSELFGFKSIFYFICGHTAGQVDGDYDIRHPWIRRLLKRIHERGHEIGLHPSYNSYNKPLVIKDEFSRLKDVCREEGISQLHWGSRQHILRWEMPLTASAYVDAGLMYDSTLGYSDQVGFRCGTCWEYQVFDLLNGCTIDLIERPLIAMEFTIMSDHYMGLGNSSQAFDALVKIKKECFRVGGNFTLLWHNNNLICQNDRDLYLSVLSG